VVDGETVAQRKSNDAAESRFAAADLEDVPNQPFFQSSIHLGELGAK
jgi:hypothetical protein